MVTTANPLTQQILIRVPMSIQLHILIRIDMSTLTIFGLQPLITYNEIHFKFILQKKQPLFANDSRYFIVSEIKVFESELFNENTRECTEIIL
jgi:hypothetical protein